MGTVDRGFRLCYRLVIINSVLWILVVLRAFEPIVRVLRGPGRLQVVSMEVMKCKWAVPEILCVIPLGVLVITDPLNLILELPVNIRCQDFLHFILGFAVHCDSWWGVHNLPGEWVSGCLS